MKLCVVSVGGLYGGSAVLDKYLEKEEKEEIVAEQVQNTNKLRKKIDERGRFWGGVSWFSKGLGDLASDKKNEAEKSLLKKVQKVMWATQEVIEDNVGKARDFMSDFCRKIADGIGDNSDEKKPKD